MAQHVCKSQNQQPFHNYNDGEACKENDEKIHWKVGDPVPDELVFSGQSSPNPPQPVLSTLVPRTLAWCSVKDDESDEIFVALLDGYTASCYTPPAVHFAASALPDSMVRILRKSGCCSLSACTLRDPVKALHQAFSQTGSKAPVALSSKWLAGLGLEFTSLNDMYPPTLSHSPIQMHCSLKDFVRLDDSDENADNHDNHDNHENIHNNLNSSNENAQRQEAMIVLIVETFHVHGSVLSPPTENMVKRNITAKIDAESIQPLVSLGSGKYSSFSSIRSMPRPVFDNEFGKWKSTNLDRISSTNPQSEQCTAPMNKPDDMEWSFRVHGSSCPLGFNATTALIMPRPIGWISTYTKIGHIPHLAPYSFFIDVARGLNPKVAFSAYRVNGHTLKDAQKNAQETGFFCCNAVTMDLAVPMNLSAAEIKRDESEFQLSALDAIPAKFVDAPIVKQSKITYECQYLKTIEIGSFSIVIGKVIHVSIDKNILTKEGLDRKKLQPLSRLGYMDEYGVFDE